MIYCKQINEDRLGNQLFRFAAAYAHARRNKDTLKADWKLNYKNACKNILSGCPKEEEIFFNYSQPTLGYHAIPYIKGMNLDGYFQSEKYFLEYSNEIRAMFRTKKRQERTAAIHVRRGDYIHLQGVLPVLTMDYYNRAMTLSAQKYNRSEFVVYTDDFDWCVENFECSKHKAIAEIRSGDPLEDFESMQNHPVIIIANSTFSWWAAWLSGHDRVIAPKIWFGHPNEYYTDKDIVPERWMRI